PWEPGAIWAYPCPHGVGSYHVSITPGSAVVPTAWRGLVQGPVPAAVRALAGGRTATRPGQSRRVPLQATAAPILLLRDCMRTGSKDAGEGEAPAEPGARSQKRGRDAARREPRPPLS